MSGRGFCYDANVLITAWNTHYPTKVFPSLWKELSENKERIIFIDPMYKEMVVGKDDLEKWLKSHNFSSHPIDDKVEAMVLELEKKYKTKPKVKKGGGADSNDIRLIAYAKFNGKSVVTFEGKQFNRPGEKSNYKIPIICNDEKIECIEFIDSLSEMGISI